MIDPSDKIVVPVVKLIEEALVASPMIEIVTVEYTDGWYIAVQDFYGNDLTVEVTLEKAS